MADLEMARAIAGDRIIIRTGLEVAYQRSRDAEIRRFLADKALDYCIGSVHFTEIGPELISFVEPDDARAYFDRREQHQAYAPYWAALRAAGGVGW